MKEAVDAGCPFITACSDIGVTVRSIRRWERYSGEDRRNGPLTAPHNKLTLEERQTVIEVCTSKELADLSPRAIVPLLADKGNYIASEATIYRILAEEALLSHRERCAPKMRRDPNTHCALRPYQVVTWDITFLPTNVKGYFYKAYVFLDIFSREVLAAKVHDYECNVIAKEVFLKFCTERNINPEQIVLHSDNGAAMKGATLQATLYKLGVTSSFSRPAVSNDNAFSESQFRTMKYHASYPKEGFTDIAHAQKWMDEFTDWYNTVHLHSGIKYVTPVQRRNGEDRAILKNRHRVYQEAKRKHPNRWSKHTRNWSYEEMVILNSKKERIEVTSSARQFNVV